MRYSLALLAALVLNATANLLIKAAARQFEAAGGVLLGGASGAVRLVATSPTFIAGIICFALNVLAYMYALQKLPISLAYPIMVTCGFAIIVIVAGVWMGERLQFVQWMGVVLMLLGVWLVSTAVTTR